MKLKDKSKNPDEHESVEYGCVLEKRANKNPELVTVAVKQVTMEKRFD
jgi:hypothetical protein